MYVGYSLAALNQILEFLENYVYPETSDSVITFMTSTVPIGALIGALIGG